MYTLIIRIHQSMDGKYYDIGSALKTWYHNDYQWYQQKLKEKAILIDKTCKQEFINLKKMQV